MAPHCYGAGAYLDKGASTKKSSAHSVVFYTRLHQVLLAGKVEPNVRRNKETMRSGSSGLLHWSDQDTVPLISSYGRATVKLCSFDRA